MAIYTEFHAPPSPTIATSGNSDEDALVQFGSMTIGSGRAYGLAGEGTPVGVQKLWTTIHQRTFLIESVPYTEIKPLLANLHASVPRNIKNAVAKRVVSDREQLLAAGFMRARKKSESLVRISPDRRVPSEGVTIDYYISLTNAYANYTFHSGETYYLSGPVSLSGQTVFEPACVLKYAPTNNARLTLTTPVSWLGEPYRPIVLTGRDDPTVGASVTNTSFTGTYATAALEINATNPVNLAYVRVTAAQNAIVINNSSHYCPVIIH